MQFTEGDLLVTDTEKGTVRLHKKPSQRTERKGLPIREATSRLADSRPYIGVQRKQRRISTNPG